MPAANFDITLDQGATYRNQFKLSSAGTPFDLTGFVARLKIARPDKHMVFSADSATSNRVVVGADYVEVYLPDEVTKTLGLGFGERTRLVYELEIEDAAGDITKLLRGNLYVEGGL